MRIEKLIINTDRQAHSLVGYLYRLTFESAYSILKNNCGQDIACRTELKIKRRLNSVFSAIYTRVIAE